MRLAATLSLLLALGCALSAQTSTGRILGTVTDSSGAAVAGASVTVRNDSTNAAVTTETDAAGGYVVTNLSIGSYTVAVEMKGFRKVSRGGYSINADSRLTADFTLVVGEVTESVEVTAVAGETVNTVSGEIARTIDTSQVQDLALNGRNYMQLASLIPGAALLTQDQLELTTSLSTTGQAINGNRPNTSNITLDGAFNLDSGSNGSMFNNVGIDFIQEVRVQSSNFSAEYGRQSGASINVSTRSGGNQFHGSAFEFLRNEKLDARGFFSPAKPSLRFNNYGYSLGGPIRKDRLFFFGGQEWKAIRRYTTAVRRSLPTRAERRGDFSGRPGVLVYPGTSTPIPGNNIGPLMTTDGKAIAAVYDRMESLASSFTGSATPNNAVYQTPNPFDVRQDLLRLDWRVNDRHTLYGRYIHDDYTVYEAFGTFINSQLPTTPTDRVRPATSWQLGHTWAVSPRLVNEARGTASWHRQRVFMAGDVWRRDQYGFAFPQLFEGGGDYTNGIPSVSAINFSGFRAPQFYISTSTDISFADTVSYIAGAHTIRAGVNYTRNRKDANGRPPLTGTADFNPNGNPSSTGNAMADAFLGNYRTYTEGSYDPTGLFRFTQFDAFVTDSWKVSRRLGIEAGLRYQAILPAYTVGNNLANFDAAAYDPARAVTVTNAGTVIPGSGFIYNGLVRPGQVPADQLGRIPNGNSPAVLSVPATAPRGFYQPAHLAAPRLSFAWSPFEDGKTAVRGGFGVFYDRLELVPIVQTLPVAPFLQTVQFENGNLANPSGGRPAAQGVLAATNAINPNLETPMTMNFSLSVQRELPSGIFLETSYVGNLGRHLLRNPDINQPRFEVLTANAALPPAQRASVNALRTYKGFSAINQRQSDTNSNYNALQVYVTRRKGAVTLTGSYTWSKALTDSSSNSEGSEDAFNRRLNYGLASFDRRHIFVGTFLYRLPVLAGRPAWQRGILGGWEASGISRFQSGQFFSLSGNTAIGTRRIDYLGGDWRLSGGERSAARWFNTAVFALPAIDKRGNTGSNIIEGPGLALFDFSFRKNFALTERFQLRFQGDLFNAFNRVNFIGLSTAITGGDFGSINSAGPGRNIQLGLRLTF